MLVSGRVVTIVELKMLDILGCCQSSYMNLMAFFWNNPTSKRNGNPSLIGPTFQQRIPGKMVHYDNFIPIHQTKYQRSTWVGFELSGPWGRKNP